jgi:hypothetical protein
MLILFGSNNRREKMFLLAKRVKSKTKTCLGMKTYRPRWSSGSELSIGSKIRGFKPFRGLRLFKALKSFRTIYFGGKLKPSVT